MKITKRIEANIIAKWKTGQFTKVALAKIYKVSEKTIRNIVHGVEPDNKGLVDLGVALEVVKKSEKTPIETKEINKAIEDKVSTLSIDDKLVKNNRKILIEAQKIIGKALDNEEVNITNVKNITSVVKDIEAVANPRTNDTKVEINNANVQQTAIQIEWD